MAEAPTDDEVNYYADTIADAVRAEIDWLSMIAKLRAHGHPEASGNLFFFAPGNFGLYGQSYFDFPAIQQGTLSAVLANAIAWLSFCLFYKWHVCL